MTFKGSLQNSTKFKKISGVAQGLKAARRPGWNKNSQVQSEDNAEILQVD